MNYSAKLRQQGFGIVEVSLALFILLILAAGTLKYMGDVGGISTRLGLADRCQNVGSEVLGAFRSYDNGVLVRTWIPQNLASLPPPHVTDPFCNGTSRHFCDSLPHAQTDVNGFIQGTSIGGRLKAFVWNSQNIRGAASFALAVYNQNNPTICQASGLIFQKTPAPGNRPLTDLPNFLPPNAVFALPEDLTEVHLKIEQENRTNPSLVDCSTTDSLANPQNQTEFKLTVRAVLQKTPESEVKSCEQMANVGYVSELAPRPAPTLRIRNGSGELIGMDECTCKGETWPAAGGCPEKNIISLEITDVYSGSLPFCSLRGDAFGAASSEGFRYCAFGATSFTVGGTPGDFIGYNVPLVGIPIIATGNVLDAPNSNFIQASAVAPDGTPSNFGTSVRFRVRAPHCDPTTYCSTQPPPGDGCGGSCPTGSRMPSCPVTRPCGVAVPDGCGGSCPVVACPPVVTTVCTDPATFCGGTAANGQPVQDSTGATCPDGTDCPAASSCSFNCFPNPDVICGATIAACPGDPHACATTSTFVACVPNPSSPNCGTCIMSPVSCGCLR